MVNIDDFIKRIEMILDYYGLNASTFADKIGVQRSSLSHLLSGRNKPSLDFVLKIMDVFPEVDLYWLLDGKGTFPKSELESKNISQVTPAPISKNQVSEAKVELQTDLFSEDLPTAKVKSEETISNPISDLKSSSIEKKESVVERIVIFYSNGTFKTYSPE